MHAHLIKFDETFSAIVRMLPAWVAPYMRLVTLIGQPAVNVSLAAALALLCVSKGRTNAAYACGLTVAAMVGNAILKNIFQRQRPDTIYVDHMLIKSYSFPSGHAFGAAVLYGLAAYLAYTNLPQPWNIIAAACAATLIISIGVSRVYLGAHFPSDVAVGWLLGTLCAVAIIIAVRP